MSLSLSPAAKDRIKTFFTQDPEAKAFRVGVHGCECSGFSYYFQVERKTPRHDDQVFRFEDVDVYVDKKSYFHLNGTQVDVAQEGTSERFAINMLEEATGCSCEDGMLTSHPDGY